MTLLQKHEPEVLAVVEKKEAEPRRDGRTTEQMKQEEEELHDAMKASLSEGWSLLLHLLERRLEVLMLTSDFYCRALEVRSHSSYDCEEPSVTLKRPYYAFSVFRFLHRV